MTNAERRRWRHAPLRHDPTLSQIACDHNHDMLEHDYMGHRDSDGQSPSARVHWQHRRLIGHVGENTYRGESLADSASQADKRRWAAHIVESWLKSPAHRDNLLGTDWTHIGGCVTQDSVEGRATQVLATVHAYLARPLPQRLSPGDSVFVSFRTVGSAGWPTRYTFAPAGTSPPSASADTAWGRPLKETLHLPDSAGTYALRVLLPAERGEPKIVEGPRVLVQRADSSRDQRGPAASR